MIDTGKKPTFANSQQIMAYLIASRGTVIHKSGIVAGYKDGELYDLSNNKPLNNFASPVDWEPNTKLLYGKIQALCTEWSRLTPKDAPYVVFKIEATEGFPKDTNLKDKRAMLIFEESP